MRTGSSRPLVAPGTLTVLALANLFLLVAHLLPAQGSVPPAADGPRPHVIALRDSNPGPGHDHMDTLEDVPFGFVFAVLLELSADVKLAPSPTQAQRLLSGVQMMRGFDIGGGQFTQVAERVLTREQVDFILSHGTPPDRLDPIRGPLDMVAERAGVVLDDVTVIPPRLPPPVTTPIIPGAEALSHGLVAIEQTKDLALTRAQAAEMLPYLAYYVASKLQVKHGKKTIMDLLTDDQRAFMKRRLAEFSRPEAGLRPAAVEPVVLVLSRLASQAPPVLQPVLSNSQKWRGMSNPRAGIAGVAEGKILYTQYCAPCHGDDGHGNGPLASQLFPKPRSLTEGIMRYGDDDGSLMRSTMDGIPQALMPAFGGRFSDDQGWAVVAYVRSLNPRRR